MFVEENFLRETLKEVFKKGWEGYLDLEEEIVEEAIKKLSEEDKKKNTKSPTTPAIGTGTGWEVTSPSIAAWQIPVETPSTTFTISSNTF